MKSYHLARITGLVLCAGLAACSTPQEGKKANELTQKTVEYSCSAQAQQALSVQYTFQGADAVTAKLIYNNQAIDLTRDTGSKTDMVGIAFTGSGYTWTTDKFTLENVGEANGNMLTQQGEQDVNGKTMPVNNILAKSCKVRH